MSPGERPAAGLTMRLGLVLALSAALVLALAEPSAAPAAATITCDPGEPVANLTGPLVPRPTARTGAFAYSRKTRVRTYAAEAAVVHYAASGRDAPPARDRDRDRVPDYVEEASAAASDAARQYAQPGFALRLPRCDRGRDRRPDIFLKRMAEPGMAVEATRNRDGSFIVVSTRLSAGTALSATSLRLVVAHELFHLVQFSYVPGGMPRWIAEGTANAFGLLGAQLGSGSGVFDRVVLSRIDQWLREPWISLYDEQGQCVRCYGGALWWLETIVGLGQPGLIHELFRRLAAEGAVDRGVKQLDEAMQTFGSCLCAAFMQYSEKAYREQPQLGTNSPLAANTATGTTNPIRLLGLSAHFVPVVVPAGRAAVELRVRWRAGPTVWAKLVVGGRAGRLVLPEPQTDPSVVVFRPRFQSVAESQQIMLILGNSAAAFADYDLGWTLIA